MLMCVLVSCCVVMRMCVVLNWLSVVVLSVILVMVKCVKCMLMCGRLVMIVFVSGLSVVFDDGVRMLMWMCGFIGWFLFS